MQPGDCLVYQSSSWIGRLIAIKTWDPNRASHVEVVWDAATAIGARPQGVARYPIRVSDLVAIMRPDPARFNMAAGQAWFLRCADGARYDTLGLGRFYLAGSRFSRWLPPSEDKLFCSELATRFYRAAGITPFHHMPDDLVPPGWFITLADDFTQAWPA